MKREREYTRLPGKGLKRGGASFLVRTRSSLWAGKTHLLAIFNTGYTEDYKRFYFKDIKSISFCEDNRYGNRNIFWGILLSSFLLLSLKSLFLLFLPVLPLLFLIRNLVGGRTCVTVLQTAASVEELPSLWRVKNAVRAMDLIRNLVEGAQKEIKTEQAQTGTAWASSVLFISPRARPSEKKETAPVYTDYKGGVHLLLFFLLCFNGLSFAAQAFFNLNVGMYTGGILSLLVTVLLIIALVKQRGSRLEKNLGGTMWLAFGYLLLTYFGIFFLMFYGIANVRPKSPALYEELRVYYSNMHYSQHTAVLGFLILMAFYALINGIYGLITVIKSWNRYK